MCGWRETLFSILRSKWASSFSRGPVQDDKPRAVRPRQVGPFRTGVTFVTKCCCLYMCQHALKSKIPILCKMQRNECEIKGKRTIFMKKRIFRKISLSIGPVRDDGLGRDPVQDSRPNCCQMDQTGVSLVRSARSFAKCTVEATLWGLLCSCLGSDFV